jgi:hypothetical protein
MLPNGYYLVIIDFELFKFEQLVPTNSGEYIVRIKI